MSKFIFITFPNDSRAYEGTHALEELHAEGSLTLYGMAIVSKGTDGKLSVKREAERGPLGIAVGALVGGVIGLLGGPAGVAIGAGGGALLGAMNDLSNLGVSGEFLDEIALELTPGKAAVVAEVSEDWVTPLDNRISDLGGIVHRTWRAEVEDELSQRQLAGMKTELAQLEAEYQHSKASAKAKLQLRIQDVELRAQRASDRLHQRLAALKTESEAKLAALQAQAIKASGDVKAKITARIAELRADDTRRAGQLEQAWSFTKKAMA